MAGPPRTDFSTFSSINSLAQCLPGDTGTFTLHPARSPDLCARPELSVERVSPAPQDSLPPVLPGSQGQGKPSVSQVLAILHCLSRCPELGPFSQGISELFSNQLADSSSLWLLLQNLSVSFQFSPISLRKWYRSVIQSCLKCNLGNCGPWAIDTLRNQE